MSTHTEGFDEAPQFMTVDQLVRLLQLPSKETVYYWNKMGTGRAFYRVGRYIRFNKDDVLKWLKNRDGWGC